ncbi:MAG: DNA primase [Acidobacteriota bacterium]|nr:DNA primase [Acidobacteriota bacterium]
MARIKDTSVDQVKAAIEILPLVEDHVRLRKTGGTYKGICPFHQEKTPSFVVTPARGTFKCFGCGEGGDAIAFVQKLEQVDFVGAIEFLANRFNIQLEYEEISPEADRARRRRERLEQLLERATSFYERMLWDSDQGAFARDYLRSRGLGEDVAKQFRLGFAPGGPTLARRARQEGFGSDELLAAGLANRRGNDYFSRRLVFPLADGRGKVRGFQARKLHDDDPLQAKYVNSPESDLFKKGDLLYGFDTARQAIAKEDRAVVVEGNTDVIALRQAGFLPVVASMGTALTDAQLRELGRLSRRLYLCFDADAAGQEATLRGMELAVKQGFAVNVVTLAKGTDPADDPAAFQRQLGAPVSYLVHRVRLLHGRAPDKNSAFAAIEAFLHAQPDSPEHLDARRLATDLLDLPPETQAALAPRGRSTGLALSPRLLDAGLRLERSALAGVAAHEELKRYLAELGPEHFADPLHRRARAHLLGDEPADGELTALLAELYARADEDEITLPTAKQLLLRLHERRLQDELRNAPPERRQQLAMRVAELREEIESLATMAAADPR